MPDDPLIERYKATLKGPHPLRTTSEPVIPINPSLLKTVSRDIQYYGMPYKLPSSAAGVSALLVTTGQVPGGEYAPQSTRKGATIGMKHDQRRLAHQTMSTPFASLSEGLKLYSFQPSSYMLSRLLVEIDILWTLYGQLVVDEYAELNANSTTRATAIDMFNSMAGKNAGDKGGENLYRTLRPVYYRAEIPEPQKFLIKNLVNGGVMLAGKEVRQGVHKDFAKMLKAANQILVTQNHELKVSRVTDLGIEPIKYIGSFRPSDLAPSPGTTLRRLSNHMIGAAVDIDSGANPHLKQPHIKVIDAILAFRVSAGHPALGFTAGGSWLASVPQGGTTKEKALALHNAIQAISKEVKAFLDEYLQLLFKQATPASPVEQEALALVKALGKSFGSITPDRKTPLERTKGVVALRKIQEKGFVSIAAEVFVACLQAGLMSGTQYVDQKDTMHFEIPYQIQKAFIRASL